MKIEKVETDVVVIGGGGAGIAAAIAAAEKGASVIVLEKLAGMSASKSTVQLPGDAGEGSGEMPLQPF